jgi:hypothetical protein
MVKLPAPRYGARVPLSLPRDPKPEAVIVPEVVFEEGPRVAGPKV